MLWLAVHRPRVVEAFGGPHHSFERGHNLLQGSQFASCFLASCIDYQRLSEDLLLNLCLLSPLVVIDQQFVGFKLLGKFFFLFSHCFDLLQLGFDSPDLLNLALESGWI